MLSPRHVLLLGVVAGCSETYSGQKPVGGPVDSDAEIERYVRRAHLDLLGVELTEAELTTHTARLRDAGNTPRARGELIDEVMARYEFASLWTQELESAVFAGERLEGQYLFVCNIVQSITPACMSCTLADTCSCDCPVLQTYAAERELLGRSPGDLRSGVATSTIERRYALANGYFVLVNGAENRVRMLFDDFLARAAERDEVENGRAMILGGFNGAPAGLLFHRHGANYAELVDIVFDSEIYREAIVRRVFHRYLARPPNLVELTHFTGALDASEPDALGLIRAVVSSREYFEL